MPLIDKIFTLLNIDVSSLKSVSLSNKVNLFSNNKKTEVHLHQHFHVSDTKQLDHIDYQSLGEETRKDLMKLLLEQNGIMLIAEDTNRRLESAKDYISQPKADTLRFFEKILPTQEFSLLRSADYIKRLYDQEKTADIPQLKSQLVLIYGQKANDICNLYTAGYFDTFLRQVYEDMRQTPGFQLSDFTDVYTKLISDFPVAIFVNMAMSSSEIENQINAKIDRLRESKLSYLNIHGIGEVNISTIENLLEKLEFKSFILNKTVSKTPKTIIVKLTLRI